MSEINQKIIDMIQKNATANEISEAVGISNKQLFYRLYMLKVKGYEFLRKYYYDGEIGYELCKNVESKKDICLLTRPIDKEVKMTFISDLHLANKDDRVNLLKMVYDFCSKEGIHIIINGGDVIDGFIGNANSKRFETPEEQIKYALKNYPYDKNIINFVCLGNHDYSVFNTFGQNFETALSVHRHDIVSLGYGLGKLKVKNDEIIVTHAIPSIARQRTDSGLMIAGHSHQAQFQSKGNLVKIGIPSLSGVMKNNLLGFIKATIYFNNGVINNGYFEQYIFLDKMYKVNEFSCQIYSKTKSKTNKIENEEDRIPYKEEEKVKKIN